MTLIISLVAVAATYVLGSLFPIVKPVKALYKD